MKHITTLQWFVVLALPLGALAAQPNEALQAPTGSSLVMGAFVLTAVDGFRGYRKGQDGQDQMLVLVKDGPHSPDYATLVIQRSIGIAASLRDSQVKRDALAYTTLGLDLQNLVKDGWQVDSAPAINPKWTVDGVNFYFASATGRDQDAARLEIFAYCTAGNDLIRFDLQAPASMRDDAFKGIEEIARTLHPAPAVEGKVQQ